MPVEARRIQSFELFVYPQDAFFSVFTVRDWLSALHIRVTGLQPPTSVHAFRSEVPFDHVDIPVVAPQPPPRAAGNVRTPPPEAADDAHTPTVEQLAREFECFREKC